MPKLDTQRAKKGIDYSKPQEVRIRHITVTCATTQRLEGIACAYTPHKKTPGMIVLESRGITFDRKGVVIDTVEISTDQKGIITIAVSNKGVPVKGKMVNLEPMNISKKYFKP